MRTISQVLNGQNKVEKCDTTYSHEKVISDSNFSLQGLPILKCASSYPYKVGHEDSAKVRESEYYVDDSTVIAIMNHSVSNGLSHILLVNPLKQGVMWRDYMDDTTHSTILATDESLTTILGTFPHALVVSSRLGYGELAKFFVKGMGIVKSIYRGIAPRENGAFVVTTELVKLDRGDPKRSIKYRFNWPEPKRLPMKPVKTQQKAK